MKSNQDVEWSQNEVCVLGYNAAGWHKLNDQQAGKTIFGFGCSPIEEKDSYYYIAHPNSKEIPDAKRVFMETHAAEELLTNFDEGLNLHQKNVLIRTYNFEAHKGDFAETNELENAQMTLRQSLKNANIPIFGFFRALKDYDKSSRDPKPLEFMTKIVQKRHRYIADRVDEVVRNDFQDLQSTMWQSKRAVADVFQENIRRQAQGEDLIPIKIVISSDQIADAATFQPNVDDMREKRDNFVTPHELRMIYKLMHELPAVYQEQMEMMRASVQCLKRNSRGDFVDAAAPWATSSATWTFRPRGQRGDSKPSYKDRGYMPSWLEGILEYKGVGPKTLLEDQGAAVQGPRP